MKPLYGVNGLVHWGQRDIEARERMQAFFAAEVARILREQNRAWDFERVEAPIMLPLALVNPNYAPADLWAFAPHDDTEARMIARPETTPSTYVWMVDRLAGHDGVRLPYCAWQAGKSFRVEQDKTLRNMRLKEFWQLEFQCAFAADTANDYHSRVLEPVRRMIAQAVALPTRVVPSDRLPDYSLATMDVEADMGDRWMEICSISKRKDFPARHRYQNKHKEWRETDILVLEIAIGLDRCVAAWNAAGEAT
jgi:glycyl-tRNA synthetase